MTKLIGYLGGNGVMTDWHGEAIGTYRITASWATPRSWVSSRMHQSAGKGMEYTGREKRG